MNILTGNREERQFIDGPELRRPYSVRPAYHPEPESDVNSLIVGAVLALVGGAVVVGIVLFIGHLLMPTIQ